MRCPYCLSPDTRVVDSRLAEEGRAIRRRRLCPSCGRRFTTFERPDLALPLVRKRDGRAEPFDREKVVAGIRKACKNRPVAEEAIQRLADELEEDLRVRGVEEVRSSEIGLWVLERLRALDEVAYIRFASVYKGFAAGEDFVREIALLVREGKNSGEEGKWIRA